MPGGAVRHERSREKKDSGDNKKGAEHRVFCCRPCCVGVVFFVTFRRIDIKCFTTTTKTLDWLNGGSQRKRRPD